jgi:hypothetical protein
VDHVTSTLRRPCPVAAALLHKSGTVSYLVCCFLEVVIVLHVHASCLFRYFLPYYGMHASGPCRLYSAVTVPLSPFPFLHSCVVTVSECVGLRSAACAWFTRYSVLHYYY